MTVALFNTSDEPWGRKGAIFSSYDAATARAKEIAEILYPIKIKEKQYKERHDDAVHDIIEDMLVDTEYVDRDDYYQTEREVIDEKAYEAVLEDLTDEIFQTLERVDTEEADLFEILTLQEAAEKLGWPSEKMEQEAKHREQELRWEDSSDQYYANAQIKNTIVRGGRGTAKMVKKYPRMIRMRYYKGDKDETRKTVEIEETGGPQTNILEYPRSDCADYRLPEIAMASDHYIMFRCPDGCDQNASIQFAGIEGYWDEVDSEGVLTFNLSCPKCKKSYHYKILFGPYDCQTGYGLTWKEQVEYFRSQRPRSHR